jgi:hypothetical protein
MTLSPPLECTGETSPPANEGQAVNRQQVI